MLIIMSMLVLISHADDHELIPPSSLPPFSAFPFAPLSSDALYYSKPACFFRCLRKNTQFKPNGHFSMDTIGFILCLRLECKHIILEHGN
jgi:hypothetical protein